MNCEYVIGRATVLGETVAVECAETATQKVVYQTAWGEKVARVCDDHLEKQKRELTGYDYDITDVKPL